MLLCNIQIFLISKFQEQSSRFQHVSSNKILCTENVPNHCTLFVIPIMSVFITILSVFIIISAYFAKLKPLSTAVKMRRCSEDLQILYKYGEAITRNQILSCCW